MSVQLDTLFPWIDAEQARDSAAAQQAERVGHQLRVAGRLDDEVEAAELDSCVPGSETYRAPDAATRSFDGSSDAVHTSRPASRSR